MMFFACNHCNRIIDMLILSQSSISLRKCCEPRTTSIVYVPESVVGICISSVSADTNVVYSIVSSPSSSINMILRTKSVPSRKWST